MNKTLEVNRGERIGFGGKWKRLSTQRMISEEDRNSQDRPVVIATQLKYRSLVTVKIASIPQFIVGSVFAGEEVHLHSLQGSGLLPSSVCTTSWLQRSPRVPAAGQQKGKGSTGQAGGFGGQVPQCGHHPHPQSTGENTVISSTYLLGLGNSRQR